MKLLHISDLHLGRRLFNFDLLEDQKIVLSQIVDIAREEAVDGVLIAGDVYNRASPSAEAMTVFSDFISALSQLGSPVFVISGNHDSAERISCFSGLLRASGIFVSETFDGHLQSHVLTDGHGSVTIHLLPFIKPANVRRFYPDEEITSYADAVRAVLANSPMAGGRHVLVAHQFITGAVSCESEEHVIGGLEDVPHDLFDAFDYVALGHLHGGQRVGREEVRYCGSPLKYSFSETNHVKAAVIVELGAAGEVEIRKIPLTQPHDMRRLSGSFEELMAADYSEDYMHLVVTDENPRPDAIFALRTVFPNTMRYSVENSKTGEDVSVQELTDMEKRSPLELFADFYRYQNNGVDPTGEQLELMTEIITELTENE